MRLLFLCGSLEPGKDGVGDYTRRLAGELVRQGNDVALVAINDRHLARAGFAVQRAPEGPVQALRLSPGMPWSERVDRVRDFISEVEPDWISLQFVPFSFHDKGLPAGLGRVLEAMEPHRPWHVMFHEIWGGVNGKANSGVKNTLLFFLQKFHIESLMRTLRPALVTTSNAAYAARLERYGVQILPLFSNIPFSTGGMSLTGRGSLQAVHFGSFSADTDAFEKQVEWLRKHALARGKALRFVAVGNGGPHEEKSLVAAKRIMPSNQVVSRGPVGEETVSQILQESDFGVSRADGMLWGKSGTTMAILEHGLPVVLKGGRDIFEPATVGFTYTDQIFFSTDPLDVEPVRAQPVHALPVVAQRLISLMSSHT